VILMAITFNLMNAFLNGRYIFTLSTQYTTHWLTDPRFIAGIALFIIGYLINRSSDRILRISARRVKPVIKFRERFLPLDSCRTILGRLWSGAVGHWRHGRCRLAFAVWTIANLAPRARSNHKWYRETFLIIPKSAKRCCGGMVV